jgi:hypothetical protein
MCSILEHVYTQAISLLSRLIPHVSLLPWLAARSFLWRRRLVLWLVVCDVVLGYIIDVEEDVEVLLGSLSQTWSSWKLVGDNDHFADAFHTKLSLVA